MKIIESKTEGKSPGRLSEDILVIMPDFIAVIDGVTPKSNFTYEGKSTGRLAAELAGQAVRELKGTKTARHLLNGAIRSFMISMRKWTSLMTSVQRVCRRQQLFIRNIYMKYG